MKVLSEERKYTAQDFERLPEGPPYYQLINGELIPPPLRLYIRKWQEGSSIFSINLRKKQKWAL